MRTAVFALMRFKWLTRDRCVAEGFKKKRMITRMISVCSGSGIFSYLKRRTRIRCG